jgi:hypothetical protein
MVRLRIGCIVVAWSRFEWVQRGVDPAGGKRHTSVAMRRKVALGGCVEAVVALPPTRMVGVS